MCCNIPFPPYNPLLDCQGNPHTNEDLMLFLKRAIKREDYEDAKIYADELKRRGQKFDPLRD